MECIFGRMMRGKGLMPMCWETNRQWEEVLVLSLRLTAGLHGHGMLLYTEHTYKGVLEGRNGKKSKKNN